MILNQWKTLVILPVILILLIIASYFLLSMYDNFSRNREQFESYAIRKEECLAMVLDLEIWLHDVLCLDFQKQKPLCTLSERNQAYYEERMADFRNSCEERYSKEAVENL